MNYKMLFQKEYSPEDINIQHSTEQRQTSPSLEVHIEETWKKLLQATPGIFNGKCYRILHHSAEKKLQLTLSTIDFKEAKGLPIEEIYKFYTPEYYPKSFCCTLFIETRDGQIIFGKKKNRDIFIGGAYAPDELLVNSGEDIFSMAYMELYQEVNIPREKITSLKITAGLYTNLLNFALVFKGDTSLSSYEISLLFKNRIDMELENLLFIPKEDLETYLHSHHPHKLAYLECVL